MDNKILMNNLYPTATDTIETVAVTQEGGEGDFLELRDINTVIEDISFYDAVFDGTYIKTRFPLTENDELLYSGDIYEDNFAVVAYIGNGTSQDIITGIESYDIKYDPGREYDITKENNFKYAFDRSTMKLWEYINVTPQSGTTLVEGADWTEVADDVEIDFKSSKTWIKNRDATDSHKITDSLRGVQEEIESDTTDAEGNNPNGLSSFNIDGISIGSAAALNTNAENYILWQWSYNKIKITTTNQSKRAIVAYDTEAGRSMTLYEGSGTVGHQIPNELGTTADISIIKDLEQTSNWNARIVGMTSNEIIYLNLTNATDTSSYGYTLGNGYSELTGGSQTNNLDELSIMYSEVSVDNQIKIGTYSGTGVTGNYVDCGFEPEYVVIKAIDSTGHWYIHDATRRSTDATRLWANLSTAEIDTTGTYDCAFKSKGFTVLGNDSERNASGQDYLFIAYAKGSKTKKIVGTDNTQVTGVTSTKTKNFATVTYTGNGTSQSIVTGIGSEDFTDNTNSSDYYLDRTTFEVKTQVGDVVTDSGVIELATSKVHIKSRSNTQNNVFNDGLRGVENNIYTDGTFVEDQLATYGVDTFTINGFDLDSAKTGTNGSGITYIAYQTLYTHIKWGVTNHNRRYVEAFNPYTNETMIIYEGSGEAGHQLPHSLGVEIDYVDNKNLNTTNGWNIAGKLFTHLQFDTDADGATQFVDTDDSLFINMSAATGSNGDGNEHILYGKAKSTQWTIIPYTGTGAAGNYIETKDVNGVAKRPRRVIIKRIDGVADWFVFDSERTTSNGYIELNTSNAENNADNGISIVSTGFNADSANSGTNASGGKYLALVEFDTDGTNDDSYFDLYEGTHNSSIVPTSYLNNTTDYKLEWTLDDGATWFTSELDTFLLVDNTLTRNYLKVSDLKVGNRDIKHRITARLNGQDISQVYADIWKASEV